MRTQLGNTRAEALSLERLDFETASAGYVGDYIEEYCRGVLWSTMI